MMVAVVRVLLAALLDELCRSLRVGREEKVWGVWAAGAKVETPASS